MTYFLIIYLIVGLLYFAKLWSEEYRYQYEEAKHMEEEYGEDIIEYQVIFILFVFVLFFWPIAILIRRIDKSL